MSRILVTGASGCVGQYISRWLLENSDAELLLWLRDPSKLTAVAADHPRIRLLVGDLRETDRFAAELSTVNRVIHTATAWGDPAESPERGGEESSCGGAGSSGGAVKASAAAIVQERMAEVVTAHAAEMRRQSATAHVKGSQSARSTGGGEHCRGLDTRVSAHVDDSLLAAGADSRAAEYAALVLECLSDTTPVICDAIHEAGGIPPLVALLAAVGTAAVADQRLTRRG